MMVSTTSWFISRQFVLRAACLLLLVACFAQVDHVQAAEDRNAVVICNHKDRLYLAMSDPDVNNVEYRPALYDVNAQTCTNSSRIGDFHLEDLDKENIIRVISSRDYEYAYVVVRSQFTLQDEKWKGDYLARIFVKTGTLETVKLQPSTGWITEAVIDIRGNSKNLYVVYRPLVSDEEIWKYPGDLDPNKAVKLFSVPRQLGGVDFDGAERVERIWVDNSSKILAIHGWLPAGSEEKRYALEKYDQNGTNIDTLQLGLYRVMDGSDLFANVSYFSINDSLLFIISHDAAGTEGFQRTLDMVDTSSMKYIYSGQVDVVQRGKPIAASVSLNGTMFAVIMEEDHPANSNATFGHRIARLVRESRESTAWNVYKDSDELAGDLGEPEQRLQDACFLGDDFAVLYGADGKSNHYYCSMFAN
jgi:hypothetical protein